MLGINLNGPWSYSPELLFTDLMHLAAPWVSNQAGQPWGQGPPLTLTADDYPASLAAGQSAATYLTNPGKGCYPSGEYRVRWDGSGTVSLSVGTVVSQTANSLVVQIDASQAAGVYLSITATDASSPIHNVRAYLPGFDDGGPLWNPSALARWQGCDCVRFMDLQATNDSPQVSWSDRPQRQLRSYMARATPTVQTGMPLELLCSLSAELGIDPWFCLPHQASDDYVTSFFTLLSQFLSPARTAYVELTNEGWHDGFSQYAYIAAQAAAVGIKGPEWYGQRAAQCFAIGEQVLGASRFRRVLSGQLANPWWLQQALGYSGVAGHVDDIAVADYFGLTVMPTVANPNNPTQVAQATAAGWTQDQWITAIQATMGQYVPQLQAHAQLAQQYGKTLVGYEGGHGTVGVGAAAADPAITAAIAAVNLDPRMAGLYQTWLQLWQQNAGDGLLNHYSSLSLWDQYGCWGLSRSAYEVTAKHQAFLDALRA